MKLRNLALILAFAATAAQAQFNTMGGQFYYQNAGQQPGMMPMGPQPIQYAQQQPMQQVREQPATVQTTSDGCLIYRNSNTAITANGTQAPGMPGVHR